MSKWYQKVSWPLVAAVFLVFFAGYLLGMVNQRLSAAVVADINVARNEDEYVRRIVAETKRSPEEIRTQIAIERARERDMQLQNSAEGQALALAVSFVSVCCLSTLIRTQYPVRFFRWLLAGANLGVLLFISWSTYQLWTLPYDTSTGLALYSYGWHLAITILALLSSWVLQIWLTFGRPQESTALGE
jgi:hypothetical protein